MNDAAGHLRHFRSRLRPLSRALLCLLSVVTVGAAMVVTAPTVGADSVASARAQAAAIAANLAAAQNKMSALGQQFDAARAQLSQVENAIVTTKASVAQKQQQVAHDKMMLQKAAVASYVSDGSAVGDNPLFSSNEKTQGAANEYSRIATGDVDEVVANLTTAKNKLSAQQAQLTVQQDQAQNAVSSEQAAIEANQVVEQQQSAALAQENGVVATLVAQQQQQAAAAAAQAAQAQIASAAAAQAKRIAAEKAAASVSPSTSPGLSSRNGGGGGSSSGSRSAPAPYVPVPVAPGGGGAVAAAETQLGVPYVWGGESPGQGFDCSGLVQWAWRQAGVNLPRTSGAQFGASTPISVADLEPGDLLFYGPDGSDHVAMYIGGGTMIEAPQTGEVVHETPLRLGGYGESFAGAGRP